ncbi:ribose-phosphate diphosphokinase [Thermoplasmatales archaeon ex4572_165]|nr:MAG: ribose-phosphate diphosphokinase [Thermoplasmatales archaeon ex4572_165]
MFLIGGTASLSIAEDLSLQSNIPIAETIIHRFPDGELYVRIKEKIEKHEILIIQTTYPDENIIELFLLLDACKRANAKKITVIIPYFGYARQDKQFKPGEPISAEALATLICVNADEIITIDPHKEHIKGFFSIPTKSVSAVPALAEYLKNKNIDVVLAPDKGALKRAKDTAKILNCEVDYLEKKRIDGSTIIIKPKQLEVKNKTVAIIDDIISTGGTMAAAITELKKQKAAKVYVACTHGLFAGAAIEKLKKAQCDEIISTETIRSAYSKVKITPVLTSLF